MAQTTDSQTRGHLGEVHQAEALVDEVEQARDALRDEARSAIGITGTSAAPAPPLRQTIKHYGLSWYPLGAIGLLAIVDTFQAYAFAVLAPEISRALGIGKGVIAGV